MDAPTQIGAGDHRGVRSLGDANVQLLPNARADMRRFLRQWGEPIRFRRHGVSGIPCAAATALLLHVEEGELALPESAASP